MKKSPSSSDTNKPDGIRKQVSDTQKKRNGDGGGIRWRLGDFLFPPSSSGRPPVAPTWRRAAQTQSAQLGRTDRRRTTTCPFKIKQRTSKRNHWQWSSVDNWHESETELVHRTVHQPDFSTISVHVCNRCCCLMSTRLQNVEYWSLIGIIDPSTAVYCAQYCIRVLTVCVNVILFYQNTFQQDVCTCTAVWYNLMT